MDIIINYWAILISSAVVFAVGALWYSPYLFGKLWLQETGIVASQIKKPHSYMVYGISFIFLLIGAYVFNLCVGAVPSFGHSVFMGFAIGFGAAAGALGINYAYTNKSTKLFLIDGGYHVVQFVIYGIIFGLWW